MPPAATDALRQGGQAMKITRLLMLGFAVFGLSGLAAAEAELAETPARATEEPPAPLAAEPRVARAVITNAIEDREPVDDLSEFRNDQPIIYFFTELQNLEGATVTHRWELDGKLMAEVPFRVGSPRWRVWSSKNLDPESTGNWQVTVVSSNGEVLEAKQFDYLPVEAPAAPAAPAGLDN